MKILVVDACVRGKASRTRRLYEVFIENFFRGEKVEILELAGEDLKPMSAEQTNQRSMLVANGELEHKMFNYAHQFKEADYVVVAAPYWDLSFPSVLKVYFEHISVTGITFGYEGSECVGYCKAKKLFYLSTCGGFVQGVHLGAEYVKCLGEMFGIHNFQAFAVEGLDIDPSKVDAIMEVGIEKMLSEIAL